MGNEERIRELEQQIKQWNEEYWGGHPTVSDPDYDTAIRELSRRDPGNPLLEHIGSVPVPSEEKVVHKVPMLSLDKAYTLEDLEKFVTRVSREPAEEFSVSPKYDGISADWNGHILSTRGDGTIGENISDKAGLIGVMLEDPDGPCTAYKIVPLTSVKYPIRGELIILNSTFQEYLDRGGTYKNSRNAVAGIVGAKWSKEWENSILEKGLRLTLIPHTEIEVYHKGGDFVENFDIIKDAILKDTDFPVDGIVVRLRDSEYAESLGHTAHHPKGAIAFKFANQKVMTVLKDVQWQPGATKITPVAILDPVAISGVTISRATLHNMENIIKRDLQIGDSVVVERAGEVIPYISESFPGTTRTPIRITHCPSCGSPVETRGPDVICSNSMCPTKRHRQIIQGITVLGIDYMKDAVVEALISKKKISTIADIFTLTKDSFIEAGVGQKMADKILLNIEKAKTTKDYLVLAACCIPGIGVGIAKEVCRKIPLGSLTALSEEDLFSEVPSIGPGRSFALVHWLKENYSLFTRMLTTLLWKEEQEDSAKTAVVFTGSMPKTREYYKRRAEEAGYSVEDSVTKNTGILVVPSADHRSSKVQKAEKYRTVVMTLDDFLGRL